MMKGLAMLLALCAATARGDELSFVNEGAVDAPIEEVWKVFATSEGYKALGPALAEVDLRIGGTIRSRYGSDGTLGDAETIENAILCLRAADDDGASYHEDAGVVPLQERMEEHVDGHHAHAGRGR